MSSDLERTFDTLWLQLKAPYVPDPVAEFRFHPPRRWRFDRCWPEHGVAVELEGGVGGTSRHTTVSGFTQDAIKYNVAAADGWAVFRFTATMLRIDPAGCIGQVVETLVRRAVLTMETIT